MGARHGASSSKPLGPEPGAGVGRHARRRVLSRPWDRPGLFADGVFVLRHDVGGGAELGRKVWGEVAIGISHPSVALAQLIRHGVKTTSAR
jgi:hypothetical protein